MRQPDYKMISGGNIQVPMNPQVAGASGRGLARLGQTLANVGVEASGILSELAQANDDKILIETREKWKNSAAEHESWALQNPNMALESQERWGERSQKDSHDIDNMDIHPELKKRLRLEHTQYSGNANRSFGRQANHVLVRNREEAANVSLYNMLEQKDLAGAEQFLESPEAKRIYSPGDIGTWGDRITKKREAVKSEGLRAQIKKEPLTELDLIQKGEADYTDMDPSERDKYESYARSRININEHEEINKLSTWTEQAEDLTVEAFDARVANFEFIHIDSARKAKMRNSIERNEPPTPEEEDKAMAAISTLAEMQKKGVPKDEYLKQFRVAHDLVTEASSPRWNGWLKQRLNHYNPNYQANGRDNLLVKKRGQIMEDATKTLADMKSAGLFGALVDEDGYKLPVDPAIGQGMRDILYEFEDWLLGQSGEVTVEQSREKLGALIGEGESGKKYQQDYRNKSYEASPRYESEIDIDDVQQMLDGKKTSSNMSFDQLQQPGKIRTGMPKEQLIGYVDTAASKYGFDIDVISGGQPSSGKRTGSHRHDHGNGMDVAVKHNGRTLSASRAEDRPHMARFITEAVANGVDGVGFGPGYMDDGDGANHIHLDLVGTRHGGAKTWGQGGRSKNTPKWVRDAYAEGMQKRKQLAQR